MKDHAKAMEFERAGDIRDEIQRLRSLIGVSSGSNISKAGRRRIGPV